MTTSKPVNDIQATKNTIQLFEGLRSLDGAGITELAEYTGLSKSTVHSHLNTLKNHGYVIQDGRTYYVGLGFFEMGEYARKQHKIYDIGRPEVDKLAEQTGELANMMVEEHGKGVYLYRAQGENAVTLDTQTGKRRYLHCTALGKAILAHLPRERVDEIVDQHGLPEQTRYTITDPESLYTELYSVREEGVAQCHQERVKGLRCVAVPILSDERVLGAISVSGPTTRMTEQRIEEIVPEYLTQAANVIEINIEFS